MFKSTHVIEIPDCSIVFYLCYMKRKEIVKKMKKLLCFTYLINYKLEPFELVSSGFLHSISKNFYKLIKCYSLIVQTTSLPMAGTIKT